MRRANPFVFSHVAMPNDHNSERCFSTGMVVAIFFDVFPLNVKFPHRSIQQVGWNLSRKRTNEEVHAFCLWSNHRLNHQCICRLVDGHLSVLLIALANKVLRCVSFERKHSCSLSVQGITGSWGLWTTVKTWKKDYCWSLNATNCCAFASQNCQNIVLGVSSLLFQMMSFAPVFLQQCSSVVAMALHG